MWDKNKCKGPKGKDWALGTSSLQHYRDRYSRPTHGFLVKMAKIREKNWKETRTNKQKKKKEEVKRLY